MKLFELKTTAFAILIFASTLNAQDSLNTKHNSSDTVHGTFKPDRPHEIGISILTPIIMLTGTSETNDRYSNLTYRYRFTDKRAFRAFVGAVPPRSAFPDPVAAGIIQGNDTNYYQVVQRSKPSNFQVGIGYEYMWGRRLKHVPSIDLVYNNVFQKDEYFTLKTYDEHYGTTAVTTYKKLDSTVVVKAYNENRYGANLSYALRYGISRRWVVTAAIVLSFRYTVRDVPGGSQITNFDFNLNGPISDVSLFFRFK